MGASPLDLLPQFFSLLTPLPCPRRFFLPGGPFIFAVVGARLPPRLALPRRGFFPAAFSVGASSSQTGLPPGARGFPFPGAYYTLLASLRGPRLSPRPPRCFPPAGVKRIFFFLFPPSPLITSVFNKKPRLPFLGFLPSRLHDWGVVGLTIFIASTFGLSTTLLMDTPVFRTSAFIFTASSPPVLLPDFPYQNFFIRGGLHLFILAPQTLFFATSQFLLHPQTRFLEIFGIPGCFFTTTSGSPFHDFSNILNTYLQ